MTKLMVSFALALLVAACGKENAPLEKLPQLESPASKNNQMLKLVNEARAKGYTCGDEVFPPVRALTWNALLEKSAAGHAKDMSDNNYFSHTAQDGSQPSERIDRAGYTWSTCGENIAKGQTSIEEVVAAWLKSPGHCKNIMNGAFTQLGASRFANTWVQNFGTPR